ncbi:copper chaperone PCu(A)C [Nocardia harenae]|uniref:copper chaperone PCu(A)C n=1 Tax=Nocardia harenae TaxID=358707 RepID=UPI000836388A|nr:copper chaperone PCu(A)C [Nocardia harenae]
MAVLSPRARRLVTASAFLPLVLAGCSTPAAPGRSADAVTVGDQWVKAADSGMSAGFGELRNTGAEAVTVVAASSPAAGRLELHEVVPDAEGAMIMRPKDGGFTIPAGGALTLRPGGDHLMFMELGAPLRTGSTTEVVLTFADGSSTTFSAQVRDFAGAQEEYAPGHGA